MISPFTVVVRPVTTKPELIQRRHFAHGTFLVHGLNRQKYQLSVSARGYNSAQMELEFPKNASTTDFKMIVLHPLRDSKYFPGGPTDTFGDGRGAPNIPSTAKLSYKRGVEFHRDGKLEEALSAYGEAIRACPGYVPPLTDAGSIYLLLNHPDAALLFFKRAQDLDPHNPAIRLNMAVALIVKSDYGPAIKLLSSIVDAEPVKTVSRLFLARAYYLQHRYSQAEEILQLALKADPHFLDARELLLHIALEQKDYAAAKVNLIELRNIIRNPALSRFIDDQVARMPATSN